MKDTELIRAKSPVFSVGMCCLLLVCVVYCWYVLFIVGMYC